MLWLRPMQSFNAGDHIGRLSKKQVQTVAIGAVILVLLVNSVGTVGAGERGIKTRFSNVVGEVMPGLYFKLPFIDHVEKMDVQTQKEQTTAAAASADLQNVSTEVAVNYNIDPTHTTDLFVNVGMDYKTKVIDPAIQEVVKAVTASYTAEELITKRPAVTDAIQKQLTDRLLASHITVSAVSIVNFNFSEQFNQAIEAKVTAEQNALAAKNKLDQVKYEAEQTVTTAQAQAQAIQIQAQAIQQQGGANYVQLQAVNKWDGHLPTQMIPNASVPFINLK